MAHLSCQQRWPLSGVKQTAKLSGAAAKAFYLRLDLDESPLDPMTLMITFADLHATAQG